MVEAARAAGAARREQAAALWRPTLGLTASAGYSSADSRMDGAQFAAPGFGNSTGVSFGTSVDGGSATRWSLGARQPLCHPERRAQQRQLSLAADAADLEWQAAQQDWMLQTAQRYFELLLAERRLALLQQQQVAVDKAYTEAQDRYALGDQPITDSHEAAARSRGLQAQVLAATNELELARQALQDSTGLAAEGLQLQAPSGQLADGQLAALDSWLALAQQHNPLLRLQQAQAEVAAAEARKHSLAGSATLDLVAQASRERLGGSGDYGQASNSQSQQMVGLALNLPLYTGGWRSAKLAEALSLEQKAKAELERARLQLAQQTRAWHFDLEEGILDSSRLSRIVANPHFPVTYKQESAMEFRDTVVTLLIDNSGSMRGRPIGIAAISTDILARTLERCGVKVEILGFTTRAWKGGQSREQWLASGKPQGPGRLNDLRHIGEAYRVAVFVGDDQFGVFVCRFELVVRIDGGCPHRAVKTALGLVDVGVADGNPHVVQRHAQGRQGGGIGLDAHRRATPTRDGHQAHARHLRELGRKAVFDQIVHANHLQRRRGDRQALDDRAAVRAGLLLRAAVARERGPRRERCRRVRRPAIPRPGRWNLPES